MGGMEDDEAPSPWDGVILVMLGVVMMLLPIVVLFVGVRRLADARIGQDISGLALSFFFGPLIVAVGIAELRKAPPQYRLRTLFIVTAMVAAALTLVYAARNY